MSFESEVELSVTIPDSELRSAREAIEDGIGPASVAVNASGPASSAVGDGGGGAGMDSRRSRRMFRWARSRTEDMGALLGTVEDIEDQIDQGGGLGGGGGDGGGGGGLLGGLLGRVGLGALGGGLAGGGLGRLGTAGRLGLGRGGIFAMLMASQSGYMTGEDIQNMRENQDQPWEESNQPVESFLGSEDHLRIWATAFRGLTGTRKDPSNLNADREEQMKKGAEMAQSIFESEGVQTAIKEWVTPSGDGPDLESAILDWLGIGGGGDGDGDGGDGGGGGGTVDVPPLIENADPVDRPPMTYEQAIREGRVRTKDDLNPAADPPADTFAGAKEKGLVRTRDDLPGGTSVTVDTTTRNDVTVETDGEQVKQDVLDEVRDERESDMDDLRRELNRALGGGVTL